MAIKMKKTSETYRGATGTSPLEISLVGGSWDELFEELRRHPKVFYEMGTDAFVGEREMGDKIRKRTPSIGTIQKEMDRQAWFHGIVLGFQDVTGSDGKVSKSTFRVCMRTTELEEVTIPKRILDLNLLTADFGKLKHNSK